MADDEYGGVRSPRRGGALTGRPAPLAEAPRPVLELRGVWKRLGARWVLKGASLSLPQGGSALIAGPNGSGKTTLLLIAAGLMEPSRGEALIAGVPSRRREAKRLLGLIAQRPLTVPYLTVAENLEYFAVLYGVEDYDPQSDWVVEILGLKHRLGEKAGSLSYGWRKRLEAARALIHRPLVLLADEPLAGLDPDGRDTLVDVVSKMVAEGMSVVATTPLEEWRGWDVNVECRLQDGRLKCLGAL